jgi:hypothetical protein
LSQDFKEQNWDWLQIGLGAAPYDLLEESCNEGNITIPLGLNYLVGEKSSIRNRCRQCVQIW